MALPASVAPTTHNVAWHIALQKTGFTTEAGHCLIVMTPVHGHMMLIVLLGDPSPQAHFQDAINLRRWLLSVRHR
jgi:D-alanyl-D-alanine endopeptidase (penicillin-binding protein 7)